jgi:ERF superfamily
VATGPRESETIAELADAFARAQAKMRHPCASQTNPRFGNRYPSLADVIDAIREPLAAEGITVWTTTALHDGWLTVTHRFRRGDQWFDSDITVELEAFDPQAIGSGLTYARRYGLSTACNIAAAGEDDDGETATRPAPITAKFAGILRENAAADGASPDDIGRWVRTATGNRTDVLEEITQGELNRLRAAKEAWLAAR